MEQLSKGVDIEKKIELLSQIQMITNSIKSESMGELKYKQGTRICENFFPNATQKVSNEDINQYLDKISKIKLKLENIESDEISQTVIENFLNNIKMFESAVYLEAEKGGYTLTDEERSEYIKKVDEVQENMYGSNLDDGEKKWVQEDIERTLNGSKKNSIEETEKIEGNLNKNDVLQIFYHALSVYGKECIILDITDKEKSYLNKEKNTLYITENDFKNRKTDVLQEFEKENIFLIENSPNTGTIAVSTSGITFPQSEISYNIERILGLLNHEIDTHERKDANNIFKTNLPGQVEFNEGMAMISEQFVNIKNIEDLRVEEPTKHHVVSYLSTQYSYDDMIEPLSKYLKIVENISDEKSIERAKTWALRSKRFYPLESKKNNRKDLGYTRGSINVASKIKDYIKKWEEGNLSTEDLENRLKIAYSTKTNQKTVTDMTNEQIKNLLGDENDIKMPLFLGSVLKNRLLGGKIKDLGEIYNELKLNNLTTIQKRNSIKHILEMEKIIKRSKSTS